LPDVVLGMRLRDGARLGGAVSTTLHNLFAMTPAEHRRMCGD